MQAQTQNHVKTATQIVNFNPDRSYAAAPVYVGFPTYNQARDLCYRLKLLRNGEASQINIETPYQGWEANAATEQYAKYILSLPAVGDFDGFGSFHTQESHAQEQIDYAPRPKPIPQPEPELIRKVVLAPYSSATMQPTFQLRVWDSFQDRDGKRVLKYSLRQKSWKGEITPIFAGRDFCASSMHAIDSDVTLDSLMTFLCLREGDTDQEYFDNYTRRQIAFRDEHAEHLAWEAKTRFCAQTRSELRAEQKAEKKAELAKWLTLQGNIHHSGDLNWIEEDTRITFSIVQGNDEKLEHLVMESDYTWLIYQQDNVQYKLITSHKKPGKTFMVPLSECKFPADVPEVWDELTWEWDPSRYHDRDLSCVKSTAECCGYTETEFRQSLCSSDPHVRALAYNALFEYGGPSDSSPIQITGKHKKQIVAKRYRNAVQ